MTLLEASQLYLSAGISVIPIDHTTKKPKMAWLDYQGRRADEKELKLWFGGKAAKPAQAMAVVCGQISGGLLVFDFDVPEFYDEWKREAGELADGLPVQRTGGGGYQVFLRCSEPGKNDKLAWSPNDQEASGREIAIETRAEGGYVVVPPSLHPSGNHYRWETRPEPFTIPVVSQVQAEALLAAARKLDRAPYTRQQIEEQERRIRDAQPKKWQGSGEQISVIEAFNQAHDIESVLLSYGYTWRGKMLVRPNGKGASVWITDGKSFHFSTNDPLNCGHMVDPFQAYCQYDHGGDFKKAVKAAAEKLGIRSARPRSADNDSGGGRKNRDSPPADTEEAPDDDFHMTDTGNALRLVRDYGHMIRFNAEPFDKWLIWNGASWQMDKTRKIYQYVDEIVKGFYHEASTKDKEARKALVKHARMLEGMNKQKQMVAKAETIQSIAIGVDDLDSHSYLFNCRNCTIDLESGEPVVRMHAQEDYLTKMSGADYKEGAECPKWLFFLETIFNNDSTLIEFVQCAVGYSLTGDISEQKLFFAYGTGKNGKSVFFNTIEMLFGDYFYKAPTEMIMQQKNAQIPSDVANLAGRRFVVTSEIEENRRLNESRVKDLTGGDTIEARKMYKDWFNFKPTHKLWIFGNHKPVINGSDEGIKRRIKILPFTVKIPDEKQRPMRELLDDFRGELSGILNWALEGYMKYREKGFPEVNIMKEAESEYFAEMDVIGQFIDECCEINKHANVQANELWKKYFGWCDARGEHAVNGRRFNSRMRERDYEVKVGHGNKTYIYGLTLKETE